MTHDIVGFAKSCRLSIYRPLKLVADDCGVGSLDAVMAAISRRENVISLADARAERRETSPVVLLEMDWNQIHAEEEPWEIGRTIWFAVAVSSALWAVIAGVLWFV